VIEGLTIKVGDKVLTLTLAEAKQLRDELNDLMGGSGCNVPFYQTQFTPPSIQTVGPTYWDGLNDAITSTLSTDVQSFGPIT
jgi:hypothetical protein